MPQTVLHIFSGDLWAGAEKMIATLLRALSAYPDLNIIALSLNKGALSETLRDSGVRTIVIPETNRPFLSVFREAMRSIKGEQVELIHSHGYKQNVLGFLIGKCIGVRCLVSTIHGLPEPSLRRARRMGWGSFKTNLDYFLLKHAFTRVIAVSRDIEHVLVQDRGFNPVNVEMIYNGIDLPRDTDHAIRNETPIHIGTVGRMVPIKEFGLFLEVASEIHRQSGPVRFSILGGGPLREQLAGRVQEMGLTGVVKFEEPRIDPSSYYASLDAYMNTSLHEGLPLSILEAMSFGKPVVAPNVGGLPEIISHGTEGFLVETRSPGDFAGWCMKLVHDRELRERMGRNASKKIGSKFSSARMVDAYRSLYASLAKGASMPSAA